MDATKEPLDQVKRLLRDFLDGRLEPDEFVHLFFVQAGVLQKISLDLIKTYMGSRIFARDPFIQLVHAYDKGLISNDVFEAEHAKFAAGFGDAEFIPFSRKEKAVDRLRVEADAYRADPQKRKPGLHIGEEELRQVVRETLSVLEG